MGNDWAVIRALLLPIKQIFAAEDAKHQAYTFDQDKAPRLAGYPLAILTIAYVHTADQQTGVTRNLKLHVGPIFLELVRYYAEEFDPTKVYIRPVRGGPANKHMYMGLQDREHMPQELVAAYGGAAPLVIDPTEPHGNAASACRSWANVKPVFKRILDHLETRLRAKPVQPGVLPVNWDVRPWLTSGVAHAPPVAGNVKAHNAANKAAADAYGRRVKLTMPTSGPHPDIKRARWYHEDDRAAAERPAVGPPKDHWYERVVEAAPSTRK